MLIVMKNDATESQIAAVSNIIRSMGFIPQPMPGIQRTTICVLGNKNRVDSSQIEMMDGVIEGHPCHQTVQAGIEGRQGADCGQGGVQ